MTSNRWKLILRTMALGAFLVVGASCSDDGEGDVHEHLMCTPSCGPCELCDTSGSAPVCVAMCGPGLACEQGVCVAVPEETCEPACGECEVCDRSGATPTCVSLCADGLECEGGACVASACDPACGPCEVCDSSGDAPACVSRCGAGEVCAGDTCVRANLHTNVEALQGPFATGPEVTAACLGCHQSEADHFLTTAHWRWMGATPGLAGHESDTTVGKQNLINNFCIAIPTNEKRCSQCHAGYGYDGPGFDFDDAGKIDCLVCHADPRAGYVKDKKTAGNPVPTVDLVLAAQSVGPPERANCGSCHFSAGGGDNVKKGDLGSALAYPTRDVDVHMGVGMTCADCHRGADHTLLGQGAHVPVSEGRIACADCHTETPHGSAILDEHALDIACQTCHIPAFSRTQATKMQWDWSTSGNRTIGTDGVETTTLGDGTVVVSYDAMKGNFVWQKRVVPTLAWWDGRVERMTYEDAYAAGQGDSGNPVQLGRPLATIADPMARIAPFKVMRGKQPALPDTRLVLVPKLFGPGGFWGGIPQAGDYSAQAVQDLWNSSLTAGARAVGQIGAGATLGTADWAWVSTEMYLGINHEVAPSSEALGAACTDCHGGALDFEALGYSCDPMSDPAGCGSRHYGTP